MAGKLSVFEPQALFGYFEDLCAIPHGSGNTKRISDYLVAFAKEHGLEYDPVKLELEAERFVLQRGSRSARAAAQFIDSLMASKKD